MAVTVFDAVGKFFADTSNLDEFIVKLERGLPSAADKAAVSTQLLKAAQLEFREAIKAVNVEGGNTAENLNRLAEAEKNLTLASAAAKEEHAALRAELAGTSEASGIAAQATEELTGKLTSMFGLIAAFEGFKALIEGTQKSVLNLELLSQKTGIAIDTLAGIEHVSEAAGVQFDQVSTALTRLSRAQVLAIEGGKQQVAAFERIGISASELKNLSPEELFYRVAEAMGNSASHAAAAASAFALLGRGGAALIPIFQQSTEALHAQVEEAAKNSAVTAEAGQSAREWEVQVANITEAFRAGMIPIMQVTIPVIKGVETGVSALSLVIRDLAAIVGGAAIGIFNSFKGIGTLISDTISGDWKKLTIDAKAIAFEVTHDFGGIGVQFKDNWQHTTEAIKQTWTQVNPLKPAKDDLNDLFNPKGDAQLHKIMEARILAEKEAADAEVDLQLQKNRALLGAAQDNYSNELKLQAQANAAKYDNAKKAINDQIELALSEGEKGRAQAIKLFAELDKLEGQHQVQSLKRWNDFQRELHQIMSQPIPLINTVPAGMETISNAVTQAFAQAKQAAQALGITLKTDLDSSLQSAFDNYNKLLELQKTGVTTQRDVDNGYKALIKSELNYAQQTGATGQSVQKLKEQLKDLLVAELAQAKASHASVQDLQAIQKQIDLLDGKLNKSKGTSKEYTNQLAQDLANGAGAWTQFQDVANIAMEGIVSSMESAFAALVSGQESFGQAMEQAVGHMIQQIAEQYGAYYAAKGIATIWENPAEGAADLAAAAALFAVAGAASALGGGSSSSRVSNSANSGTPGPAANSPNLNAGSGPSQVVNVTHFADGGIATRPMLAMIAEGGKASEEAIIPLHDQNAIEKIAAAFMEPIQRLARLNPSLSVPSSFINPSVTGSRSGSVSGVISHQDVQELVKALKDSPGGKVQVIIEGNMPLLVKELNHGTKTKRWRLHSTSTDKTIKQA
jgi:hypothetical protein